VILTKIITSDLFVLVYEIELSILRHGGGWTFTFELEDHYSVIMARGEQIYLGVRSNDPEPIIIPFE